MKRKNLLYLLLLLTLGSGAQTRQWGTLTEEDGLHSATVTSVLRDQYGFVFFGTEQGVSRFDGTHLLNIDFPENNTQRNLHVNTIMENDRETLLIGNNVGLWKVDRRHLSMRRVHQDVIDTEVFDLLRTSDGTLFIATAQGLFKMSHDRVETVNIFAHQPTNNHSVRKTAVCGKHLCLLAANRVATAPVERPEAARFHSLPAPFTHATLLSMASDKKRVYLGTREHGLLVFTPPNQPILLLYQRYPCGNQPFGRCPRPAIGGHGVRRLHAGRPQPSHDHPPIHKPTLGLVCRCNKDAHQ